MGNMVPDVTFAVVVSGLSVAFIWFVMKMYYTAKLDAADLVVEHSLAENAKLKVAIAAAEWTGDAKKVCDLTLAALNAAYPGKSGSPEPEKEEVHRTQ